MRLLGPCCLHQRQTASCDSEMVQNDQAKTHRWPYGPVRWFKLSSLPAKAPQDSDHLRASRLSAFRSKLATRDEPSASAANFAKLSRSCFAGSMDPGAPT